MSRSHPTEFAAWPDAGDCYRCGKPLGDICPVLLALTRNGKREEKKLCDDCFQAVFDSIKPIKEAQS